MRFLALIALATLISGKASSRSPGSAVEVVKLSVNGRFDNPMGLDDRRPTLAWQILQTQECEEDVCPGDKQTAFQIQIAASEVDLEQNSLIWDSGEIQGRQQQDRVDRDFTSRETAFWHVRVWDTLGNPSEWSQSSKWTVGLLDDDDWGEARWIDYPDRTENQPLPLFARQFDIPEDKGIIDARLYVSGIGLHHVTVNGQNVTDEVLAPGNSNYQLSSEYRTYDVTAILGPGGNAIGISLGNGPAYVRRSVTNPAVGRNSPYSWWQSQLPGNGTLEEDLEEGATAVQLSSVASFYLGGTINIDTAGGGDNLESRVITAIDNSTNTITFEPGLTKAHGAGAKVTASGNNIAASDPAAGAAVSPRVIGRLEIVFQDGSESVIVTDRSWRTTLGPLVTDAWYSGSDYDARRYQGGWDSPSADLSSNNSWTAAGNAPPPNLATKLVARTAEPIKIQERLVPESVTNPAPGTWVFDFGQNIAGLPLLTLPEVPAGLVVKMVPAESLNANGTVNQESLGSTGSRGTNVFNTYTTSGRSGGETWHPQFNYFPMQWVQVTGLPSDFEPSPDLITGLRVQADVPTAGTFTSSNARINRLHKMCRYSFASNMMSVFTDCPGREKLSYPADYTQPMGAIFREYHLHSFMHTTMRHLVEAQSLADTPMAGNIPLKTPVYDWGYEGRFGDEINWGNAIILVPSFLQNLYGDTTLIDTYYDQMMDFVDYIQREKVRDNIVDAALADWVDIGSQTSGRVTGTWGYYLTIKAMAKLAAISGREADAEHYTALASDIRDAFNGAFFNENLGYYTTTGNNGTGNATQATQALALDAGLVPEEHRESVLDALVRLIYDFPSSDGEGPHFSGGTIGLGPIVRALSAGGRDDVLWDVLQEDDEPSYGYFLASTPANPNGFTTIGERWHRGDSKNHMILAQINEWFHAGIAGIRPHASLSTLSALWDEERLVFQPKPVGDVTSAVGTYLTPWGEARSEWEIEGEGTFKLTVTVPANTEAEVRVPVQEGQTVTAPRRAEPIGTEDGYAKYTVPSGTHTFTV